MVLRERDLVTETPRTPDPGHDLEAVPATTSPVFIVGLPRSGTTLMAVCLDRHPAFHCGPETHLLSHLATQAWRAALDPSGWPDVATDLLCGLAPDGIPVYERAGIGRQRIRDWLAGRPPSVAAMLESLVATQASDAGKRRWVEKTPRHLDHVPQIRATWPDASIIHMIRDPRARAISMTRVPFGSESLIRNLRDGARREQRARLALEQDPRVITVPLEDLVDDADGELQRVCSFLGEAYAPDMLEPSEAPDAIGPQEWWKARASRIIEPSGDDGWRSVMDPAMQRFAGLYCADQIRRGGYPEPRSPRRTLVVVPAGTGIIHTHESLALSLAAADVMLADVPSGGWAWLRRADMVAFWGKPGQLLPRAAADRGWRQVGEMTIQLAIRRLRRRPAWWIAARTRHTSDGLGSQERWLARMLRVLARRGAAQDLVAHTLRDTSAVGAAQDPV